MSLYAKLLRKRETSGPSLIRLMGFEKGGGLVRSSNLSVGKAGKAGGATGFWGGSMVCACSLSE